MPVRPRLPLPSSRTRTRIRRTRRALLLAATLLGVSALGQAQAPGPAAGPTYKIVTASERGTYIQIGRDLARWVAPAAGIGLEALPSAGSAENVQRLRREEGVKLALVQSDVFQAFIDLAATGNAEATNLIRPLRVVLPLYNEEIYFIVRADSPLKFVHEIKDARINAGPLRSGTAMSTTTLYRLMFGTPLPEGQASYLSNEDALSRLVSDRSLDVVVVVAGQPAKLLADMKPEARQLIRLLRFDAQQAAGKQALRTYFPVIVRQASYPNLLAEDLPGLAVRAYLVTYDYRTPHTTRALARFARALCEQHATLQAQGHPKWREVSLQLPPLGEGWRYLPATERELRNCRPSAAAPASAPEAASSRCSQQERVLGLCR